MALSTTVFGKIARHDEDPFWGLITIVDGLIAKIERGLIYVAEHMFGEDCLIFAGFSDIHIHAREDETGKQNYKETYATAVAAALNGGVVATSAMPNTWNPVTTAERLAWHRNHVCSSNYPVVVLNYVGIDATTKPLDSNDPYKLYFGKSVGTLTVTYAGELDAILPKYRGRYVSFHVEYEPIVQNWTHGKTHSDRRPVECVTEGLRLLLTLIEKHEIKAKLCHWPVDAGSFELIREYRARGCEIDLEVSPLHLYFNKRMAEENPELWLQIQMNPAVQGPEHQRALIDGLRSGFIQHLATDHAPHTEEEKHSAFAGFFPGRTNKECAEILRASSPELFEQRCVVNNHSGAPWLDTYSLVCCWLMREHGFRPQDIARVAAYNPGHFVNRFLASQYPGRNFGKGFGDVAVGYVGSFTVLNLAKTTIVRRENLKSQVGWSALEGHEMPGAVEGVFIEGKRY